MATPLVTAMNTISTLFEAATPPDRTNVTYHEVDGRNFLKGTAGDRTFMFGLPTRLLPRGERGAVLTQVEWELPIYIRFSSAGRSQQTRVDSAANEINLLMRTIESLTEAAHPAGVLSLITDTAEPSEPDEKGDAVYTLTVLALCEETD